jgi:glycine oxidase
VVGLSIAWELANRGVQVDLFEGQAGTPSASWAGAGMIAPVPTRRPADAWGAFRAASLNLHATWAERLHAETGIDTGYRRCGGIDVAIDAADVDRLNQRRPLWEAEGIEAEWLTPAQARQLEPELTGDICGAYLFPGRAQLRNPWHLRALAEASRRRGVRIHSGISVEALEPDGARVASVRTTKGRWACGTLVVAAGPWTERLLAPLGVEAPTPPLRGQIALVRWDAPRLLRIVECGPRYLVPRDDGRVLIGSTEEWAGYDPRPTTAGIAELLAFALRLCPGLGQATLERAWAALRPASRDGLPYIGRVTPFDNLLLAAGHRRTGVQLAPATAVLVADLVTGTQPTWEPTLFGLDRPAVPINLAFDS